MAREVMTSNFSNEDCSIRDAPDGVKDKARLLNAGAAPKSRGRLSRSHKHQVEEATFAKINPRDGLPSPGNSKDSHPLMESWKRFDAFSAAPFAEGDGNRLPAPNLRYSMAGRRNLERLSMDQIRLADHYGPDPLLDLVGRSERLSKLMLWSSMNQSQVNRYNLKKAVKKPFITAVAFSRPRRDQTEEDHSKGVSLPSLRAADGSSRYLSKSKEPGEDALGAESKPLRHGLPST